MAQRLLQRAESLSTLRLGLCTLAFLIFGFTSLTSASAQDAESGIVSLSSGERSPFSGMLFPERTAVNWRNRIHFLEEQLRIDVQACEDAGAVRIRQAEAVLALERAESLSVTTQYSNRIRDLENPGFFQRGETLFVLGLTSGILASVVIGILVVSATK